jgi:acetyl-CoA carboxylase biotin carboxyl carrier protein
MPVKPPRRARASVTAKPTKVEELVPADELETLASVLRRHELAEIELKRGDFFVRMVAQGGAVATYAASALPAVAPAPIAPSKLDTTTETSSGNVSYITSPFVGTFYSAPNPEAAPFVGVGTKIKKGQVLCIVEAMKLMNEIEAEVDGTIEQLLVENGQPVEYGEPLFKLRQG